MHKIVLLDKPRENPGELDWSALQELGQVAFYEHTTPDQAAERIGDADIVLLNKTVLSADTLRQCKNLKFISVIATGYNTVDIECCKELGIQVSNVPSYGTEAISQHAIALLMELTNRVAHHDAEVRKGRKNGPTDWCFWDYSIMELEGKTAGIIGLGRIGKISARILSAFGMNILAYDKFPNPALGLRYASLEEIFAQADILSLHCPLTEETNHLINGDSIARMKDGVVIVNTSRGALVNTEDLIQGIKSGKVGAACLDVYEEEGDLFYEDFSGDVVQDDKLVRLIAMPNVIVTSHQAFLTKEALDNIASTTVNNLVSFFSGSPDESTEVSYRK